MPTIAEIDASLHQASTIPPDRRNAAWYVFVDALLVERERLANENDNSNSKASIENQQRTTRLLSPTETR